MDAIELLTSDAAALPRLRQADDFLAFLDAMFKSYLGKVSSLDSSDYVTQEILKKKDVISTLCDKLTVAVKFCMEGLPHKAFEEIETAIRGVRQHLGLLHTPNNVAGARFLSELYRIRVAGPEGANFGRADLFHIPFDKQHLISRQRYSLPGLPCLYLGGTLYICWQELGRPSFDSVYYSRFKPRVGASLKFLDFGYRPAWIAGKIKANQANLVRQTPAADFAVAQAVCWPLLAACSIKRMHASAPFIHEYIVPQLLLQWIVNQDKFDGIRYFSVNEELYQASPAMVCNYVFPARSFAATGHCARLRGKFELCEPLSWQIAQGMSLPGPQYPPVHSSSMISLIRGALPGQYRCTTFCMMESKSLGLECHSF